jgi:hypothetical protein
LLRFTRYEALLILLFLLTLPLSNPWVRGDGVGYYAFARAMLIEHRLDFTKDWLEANTSFRMDRVDAAGHLLPGQYTSTGHIDNHFSVGPAMLWSPFLLAAHSGVILYDRFGGHVSADGFSKPYLVAMALGTAVYGFLAVAISFQLARRYVSERWAFLAAVSIWFATPLPVYMYFNPSWSHAHSAFTAALFAWYWATTQDDRTWKQWAILGAIGGLMLDVYYVSAVVLLFPLLESIAGYWHELKEGDAESARHLFFGNLLFAGALFFALLPTMIAKRIIYGTFLKSGYEHLWVWNSPALLEVGFSADHGLFSWNPVLIFSFAGLFCLRKYDRKLGDYSIVVVAALLYVIGCYADWDGISSFGSRFFVSLTVLFVLGLAALWGWFARTWQEQRTVILAWSAMAVLVLWNLGLIFQWGLHLIPERGPISWRAAAHNQVAVVPKQATDALRGYLTRRKEMMDRIEEKDVRQMKSAPTTP